jgi:hypothetical protein
VAALFTMVLAALAAAATASVAHQLGLAHYHLAGGIPMGALAIGAGTSLGVILAIKLSSGYDTAGYRIYAQLGAVSAYGLAVLLDYLNYQVRFGPRTASTPEVLSAMSYAKLLIDQGSAAIIALMPKWISLPDPAVIWLGVLRLVVEGIAAIVATGWTISFLTGVPFCARHRRFYELRHLTESADVQSVRQWETAIRERRPVEARALLARVRAARVQPFDRSWVRIAVHQCSICQAARVRVEKRRRSFGRVVTEPMQEFVFDPVKGSVLLAT